MPTPARRNAATGRPSPPKTPTAGPLAAARRRLADAVAGLADPQPETKPGGVRYVDSRYRQLRDALYGVHSPGRGSIPRSLPPLWLDAHDTLAWVDRRIRLVEPSRVLPAACGHCGHIADDHPTVLRLRTLLARKWRPQDTAAVNDLADDIAAMNAKINTLFEPQPKYLPDPCPLCGKDHGYHRDSTGEMVRSPALQITLNGCVCQNCHTRWGTAEFGILARMLGYPPIVGVVAT